MSSRAEQTASESLAAFLVAQETTGFSAGYRGPTAYLMDRVRDGIRDMAKEIAQEVIDAHPSLRDVIRRKAEAAVRAALSDDKALAATVSAAMAAGLVKYVRDEG